MQTKTMKTNALVIKLRDIGENDRILTILSSEYGIIEVSAKNIKKSKNHASAACQLFAYSEFCIYKGKNNYLLNSAEVLELHYNLRLDLLKTAVSGYFCELVKVISPTPENTPACLKLLLNTLYLLENDKKELAFLKSVFEFRMIALAGYAPNLVACSVCASFDNDVMYLIPERGTLLCEDCLPISLKNLTAIPLPRSVFLALRHILYADENKIFQFSISPGALRQLAYVTEAYTIYCTETNYKSLEIYHSLTEMQIVSPEKNTEII